MNWQKTNDPSKNYARNANQSRYMHIPTSMIIILIISTILLSVSGCTDSNSLPVTAVTLTTDNDTYRSSEEIVITVDITASRDADATIVNISGIKNSFERNMLEDSKTVHLTEGDNTVQFTFETPSCGDCSGVAAGNHTIAAIVEVDGIKYNATTVVVLEADEEESADGESGGDGVIGENGESIDDENSDNIKDVNASDYEGDV